MLSYTSNSKILIRVVKYAKKTCYIKGLRDLTVKKPTEYGKPMLVNTWRNKFKQLISIKLFFRDLSQKCAEYLPIDIFIANLKKTFIDQILVFVFLKYTLDSNYHYCISPPYTCFEVVNIIEWFPTANHNFNVHNISCGD